LLKRSIFKNNLKGIINEQDQSQKEKFKSG